MTALERCHELGHQIESQGWNRELYEELNETAYQAGITVTESFEDGFFMVEDEVYYINED
jgi:hypothetical protein